MASTDVVSHLEQRASLAEQMIDQLTKKVQQLQAECINMDRKRLMDENEKLRLDVNQLRSQLVAVESAKGISQHYDFSKSSKPEMNPSDVPILKTTPLELEPKLDVKMKAEATKKEVKLKAEGMKREEKGGANKEDEDGPVNVSRLDFRVGRIVSAKKHPDADSLYVEEVDVGEGKMRTVVSGLVKFVPLEEMQNRMAILLCNLKAAKMRGITSEAMVMCASTPEKVEILTPPEGSSPGDLVHFEGFNRLPDAVLNPKKKIFETCAPDLKTDEKGIATYKGVPFHVPGKGVIVSPSLKSVPIK